MTLDGRYRAVVDRIEDDLAVLLVEDGGEVIDEVVVDCDDLPSGVEAGTVAVATFEDGAVRRLGSRPVSTDRRRSTLQDRFDRLADRPPGANRDDDTTEGDPDG